MSWPLGEFWWLVSKRSETWFPRFFGFNWTQRTVQPWDLFFFFFLQDTQIILQKESYRMNRMTTLLAGEEQPLILTRDQGPLKPKLKSWSTHLFGQAHRDSASCCAAAMNGDAQYDNLISGHINNWHVQIHKLYSFTFKLCSLVGMYL